MFVNRGKSGGADKIGWQGRKNRLAGDQNVDRCVVFVLKITFTSFINGGAHGLDKRQSVCLVTSRSADEVVGCLCDGGREDKSQQDWLAGEMNKIRLLKKQRNFDKAFASVNGLLNKAPNFPDALYLKGHLLWEGFKNPWAAEKCFRRVIELTEDNQPVHRWASSCLSGIYSKVGF